MTGQPDAAREATEPSAAPWRVGTHYGIHVYEGDRPVATFHTIEDAARAVADHNGAADRQRVAREAVSEALAEVERARRRAATEAGKNNYERCRLSDQYTGQAIAAAREAGQ